MSPNKKEELPVVKKEVVQAQIPAVVPVIKTDEELRALSKLSQISLDLEDYSDIFSDFDPRPYSQRALSDDFLSESRKASRDKVSGQIELGFLMPAAKRSAKDEAVIKKRLREHFKKHHLMLEVERKNVIKQGVYFATFGILIMFIATLLIFSHAESSVIGSFFVVLLEPAGWFLVWEGLHLIVFDSKAKRPEVQFYEKMSKANIVFISN